MTSVSHQPASSPLAFRQAGAGDRAIVFVHGMCQSSVFWQPTLDELPAGFRGYALDLPGFGGSRDVPPAGDAHSIAGHAAAVDAFLAAHDLRDVILVGSSMGGIVCQYVAAHYPERLSRLVLVSTGPNVPDPAGALAAADSEALDVWDRAAAADYVSHFFVRPPADLEPYIDAAEQASLGGRVDTRRSSALTDLRPDLPRIAVPTLIVQGALDGGRTPAVGAEMAGLIPGARLEVIDGVGHTPMLEDPATWRRIFHGFLAASA
jgi:pimeloyl-ACP methyl ester carboxylesterase